MARELVERNGIGDTADSAWRALSPEHQKLFPRRSHSDDDGASIEMPDTQPLSLTLRISLKKPWTAGSWSSSDSDQTHCRERGEQGPLSPRMRPYSA